MGVTSCVLGYADEHLNKAIYKGLKNGSMTTLNATEEIDLAKELLKFINGREWLNFVSQG